MTLTEPLVAHLFRHAEERPGQTALICGPERIDYDQFASGVRKAAQYLAGVGVTEGDRVILAASSSPAFAFGYFGTHLLGAVAMPVDPRAVDSRLDYIVKQTSPAAIFLTRPYDTPSSVVRLIDDLRTDPTDESDSCPPVDSALADILFTTGTTGHPKGVVLTHRNIMATARNINQFIQNGPDDLEVVPLPLSHSFGLGRLRCVVLAGGTLALVNGIMPPGPLFEALESHRATGFSFVPAGWAVLLRLTRDKLGDCADQLKYIEIGSAPMPAKHKHKLMELLPHTRICMHYGLTEASRSTFIEFHSSSDCLESIGRPTPNVTVEIVGADGTPLPAGETGEVTVKSDSVMHSYWRDPELTASTLRNGRMHTGDAGFVDTSGRVFLRGRKSELINVGGLKVAPGDVDLALGEHEAISECACVGVPDSDNLTGETVKAFMVCKPHIGQQPKKHELVAFLRNRVEPHEIPTIFEWVDEIPRTDSGKIQRELLKIGTSEISNA